MAALLCLGCDYEVPPICDGAKEGALVCNCRMVLITTPWWDENGDGVVDEEDGVVVRCKVPLPEDDPVGSDAKGGGDDE